MCVISSYCIWAWMNPNDRHDHAQIGQAQQTVLACDQEHSNERFHENSPIDGIT